MALTLSLTIPSNIVPDPPEEAPAPAVYPNSYVRVFQVRAFAQDSVILVFWYADEDARRRDDPPVQMQEFSAATPDLTGDIYPAAYAYLKTLPDFEGAVDC